jgi:hypothetical protein
LNTLHVVIQYESKKSKGSGAIVGRLKGHFLTRSRQIVDPAGHANLRAAGRMHGEQTGQCARDTQTSMFHCLLPFFCGQYTGMGGLGKCAFDMVHGVVASSGVTDISPCLFGVDVVRPYLRRYEDRDETSLMMD